ncbi:MAG: hypothetical protein FWD61_11580 [Phycisphaerales bacterium]|nr:hypothetical protein [Phycisphaerales bacterium]
MTKLSERKWRLRAETLGVCFSQGKYRAICIEAHPTHLAMWLKGTRTTTVCFPYATLYELALRREVELKTKVSKARKRAERK